MYHLRRIWVQMRATTMRYYSHRPVLNSMLFRGVGLRQTQTAVTGLQWEIGGPFNFSAQTTLWIQKISPHTANSALCRGLGCRYQPAIHFRDSGEIGLCYILRCYRVKKEVFGSFCLLRIGALQFYCCGKCYK